MGSLHKRAEVAAAAEAKDSDEEWREAGEEDESVTIEDAGFDGDHSYDGDDEGSDPNLCLGNSKAWLRRLACLYLAAELY